MTRAPRTTSRKEASGNPGNASGGRHATPVLAIPQQGVEQVEDRLGTEALAGSCAELDGSNAKGAAPRRCAPEGAGASLQPRAFDAESKAAGGIRVHARKEHAHRAGAEGLATVVGALPVRVVRRLCRGHETDAPAGVQGAESDLGAFEECEPRVEGPQ